MQHTSGLRAVLSHQAAYRAFRRLTGSDRVNRIMAEEYIRARPDDVVFDVGCGPADILSWLPDVKYFGVDLSPDYVAAARQRHAGRGVFWCSGVEEGGFEVPPCDVVLSLGVMHHLDDAEVVRMLRQVAGWLKPGGRFVSYDPCFTPRQHPLARLVHRLDRGKNVRFADTFTDLVQQALPQASAAIRTDLCFVPATVIVFQWQRN